jgi:hypothetical protein
MRRSSFGAVVVTLLAVSGCRIEPKIQALFEDRGEPVKTSVRDWNGEPITIHNAGNDDGSNPAATTGGVEVWVSPTATKISVEAVFAAWADDDLPSNAWASMDDAKKTLQIGEGATGFDIVCGHGQTHGTSRGAGAGCMLLRVTIPTRAAAQPHTLSVISGGGSVRVGLADAGDPAPYVRSLLVDNAGQGDVVVRVRPVKDAMLRIAGEGSAAVALPSDFSARKVVLSPAELTPSSNTEFPGMTNDAAYPPSGASVGAAAELDVRSKSGTIALSRL